MVVQKVGVYNVQFLPVFTPTITPSELPACCTRRCLLRVPGWRDVRGPRGLTPPRAVAARLIMYLLPFGHYMTTAVIDELIISTIRTVLVVVGVVFVVFDLLLISTISGRTLATQMFRRKHGWLFLLSSRRWRHSSGIAFLLLPLPLFSHICNN